MIRGIFTAYGLVAIAVALSLGPVGQNASNADRQRAIALVAIWPFVVAYHFSTFYKSEPK